MLGDSPGQPHSPEEAQHARQTAVAPPEPKGDGQPAEIEDDFEVMAIFRGQDNTQPRRSRNNILNQEQAAHHRPIPTNRRSNTTPQANQAALHPEPPVQAELERERAVRGLGNIGRRAGRDPAVHATTGAAGGSLHGQARAAHRLPRPAPLRPAGRERCLAVRGEESPLRRRQSEEVRERSSEDRRELVVRESGAIRLVRRRWVAAVVGGD